MQTVSNCLHGASNAEREPKKRAGECRAVTIEAEGQKAKRGKRIGAVREKMEKFTDYSCYF